MLEEQISFYSGPGYKLSGVLYMPEGPAPERGFPAVVLCLGYRPVFGMFAPRYAAEFVDSGYAVLTFEYRGFGASEGPKWRHIATEQLDDICNALTYLTTRQEIDSDRIAAWGDGSYGGAHAVMAAAQDQRFRCVVASTPFADGEMLLRSTRSPWEWAQFLESVDADRRRRVTTGETEYVEPDSIMNFEPSSRERVKTYSSQHPLIAELRYPLSETADSIIAYKPVDHVHLIAPRPLLVIGAEKDYTIPSEQAELLYERAGAPKKLVILKGAGHNDVHNRLLPTIVELGVDFFDVHLDDRTGRDDIRTES